MAGRESTEFHDMEQENLRVLCDVGVNSGGDSGGECIIVCGLYCYVVGG